MKLDCGHEEEIEDVMFCRLCRQNVCFKCSMSETGCESIIEGLGTPHVTIPAYGDE
jgi:hypothetical protein